MNVDTNPHNVVIEIKNIKNRDSPEIIFENIDGLYLPLFGINRVSWIGSSIIAAIFFTPKI
tara:strand:- start:896 stop:1078 length:183 start_codon:yes stop_codon:yes gene_type:complete